MRPRNFSLRSILFADLAGYSLKISRAEITTLDFMDRAFQIFRTTAPEFGGGVVKTTGDGVVVEFISASQSVEYAVEVQSRLKQLATDFPDEFLFRIGIHLGEVERTDTDIYGHAVNIAARLEAQARPGGICVSHEVFQHAQRSSSVGFASDGVASLKNIPDAVSTYHVVDIEEEGLKVESKVLGVKTIDGLEVSATGKAPASVRSDRVRALIGYLALQPDFSETAERLAALLWPDKPAAAAKRSLSGCFRIARTIVEDLAGDVLYRKGTRIGLDISRTDVDLLNFLQQISTGSVADLMIERPDWPDSILFGSESVSQLFKTWLKVARHNWRTRMIDGLESCILRHEPHEISARRAAMAILVIEPSHEQALQKLVHHHAAAGNLPLAIKTYREFAETLQETYGIAPSAQTVELINKLSQQQTPTTLVKPDPAIPTRLPRIAIGDFNTERVGPVNLHLVAGFRSEILANLSRFRDWVIVETQDAPDADSSARPDYIMTATCDTRHSQLAMSVILTETINNRVIWSNRFDITIENWFDAQRLLVKRIAAHTEIYLSTDRLSRIMGTEGVNASDYNDWLRGEHLLSLWTRAGEDEAEAIFTDIIERSPEFAPAYASLASIYNVRHLIRPGSGRDATTHQRALPLALKAVELDALDARNHQTVAWSAAMNGQYERAAFHYELATNLNGSSPKALVSCAQGLAFVGASDKAKPLLDEAIELAPFFLPYQWCYVASTHYMMGNYEEAVDAAKRGGHATMDNPAWRAASLAQLGRIDEAREAFEEEIELVKPDWANDNQPSGSDVLNWFTDAFPIGKSAQRASLNEAMQEVVAGM